MPVAPWQEWIYKYRVHVYRPTQTIAAGWTGETWAKIASDVPCYKEPLSSTLAAEMFGRIEGDNMFSMDLWHFAEDQDVQADDVIRNITYKDDGTTQVQDFGENWRIRGQQRAYASLGALQLGRKIFMASLLPTAPIGTDPLMDLMGVWKMEEATGTRADSSGRGNNLAMTGAVGQAAGLLGNAGSYAAGGYLSIASNEDFAMRVGRSFTFLTRFYLTDKSAVRILGSKWEGPSLQQGWVLEYDNIADRVRFRISEDGVATKTVTAVNLVAPALNTWYQARGWYDAENSRIGIQVATPAAVLSAVTLGGVTGVFNSTANFVVGANSDPAGHYHGRIDETQYYRRVLTDNEFTDLVNIPVGRSYPYV